MLVTVSGGDPLIHEYRCHHRNAPVHGPACQRIRPSEPGKQLRKLPSAEIRPDPNRPPKEYHPGYQLRVRRRDGTALPDFVTAIEHQTGFLLESAVRPVIYAPCLCSYDLTVFV